MINKLLVIVFVILSSCNNDSIINNRIISKHLSTLSDDKMEGRRAGTNGIEKAAKYIESEFEIISSLHSNVEFKCSSINSPSKYSALVPQEINL